MYEGKTRSFLQHFGVGETYQGFQFCIYSVKLAAEHPDWLCFVTKNIYPEVAKKYSTSFGCVERNIRTVSEVIWQNGGGEFLSKTIGIPTENKRPTNSRFLMMLVSYALSNDDISQEKTEPLCDECKLVADYKQKINRLEEEIMRLQETVNWLLNII